ncbi:hypothetical protein ACEUEG_05665 [Aeromonas media]|uniref:hypothetical protein n=1 Tax=Aeromonas TaxID=642 RepID=UPI001D0AA329|nr:hypothetical protein [Aeromonas veronii]UDN21794.1 hypothetical protein LEO77_14525 [Aeromonas veronii]
MLTDKNTSNSPTLKFSDVAKQCKESVDREDNPFERYVEGGHMDTDCLNISRWGVFGNDYVGPAFHRIFRKGQILYGSRRTYLRKVAEANFDGITANTTFVIEPKKNINFVSGLLKYLMLSEKFTQHSISVSKGSTNPYINWKDIGCFSFKCLDVHTQKKYLSILDKNEEVYSRALAVFSSAQELKRVLIAKLFSPETLKSHGARLVKLKNHMEIQSGQVDPTISPYKEMSHIAPDNIEKGTGRLLDFQSAERDCISSGKYLFGPEHVLYSKIRPNLRKVCFPRFEGVCSADVYPIKGCNGLTTDYLFYLMQTEHFHRYAEGVSMRSGFPKINRDDLGAYSFFIPSEFEQDRVFRLLRQIDGQLDVLNQKLQIPFELRRQILNKLVF